ncbi:MAG: DUF3825 domain-containing protein [Fibrobacter sp.]|nr:DUF3825 domain-containing protein [Fibrobacter sp.]
MTPVNLSEEQKAKLEKKIKDIIASLEEPGSWCNLTTVAHKLRENDIFYKEYGFARLTDFMNEFSNSFELRSRQNQIEGAPSIPEIRIKTGNSDSPKQTNNGTSYTGTFGKKTYNTPKHNKPSKRFFEWAFVDKAKIEDLAENLAIREKWYFGEEEPAEPTKKYMILIKYLIHTYGKLCDEKGIFESKDEEGEPLAAFNTGLVDKKYEYIYALFRKNKNQKINKEWWLAGFFTAGSDWGGKLLVRCFNPLPPRADYFKGSMKYVLYEPSSGEFHLDYDHILIENCRRLPAKFFENNCRPDDFTRINGLSFSDAQKLDEDDERSKEYFKNFQQKLMESDQNFRFAKQLLEQAVEIAKKRAEWNYKTAIPMYFPTLKKMSFLLPLSLLVEGQVDVALVVEKLENGNYQGQTILPLDWAYSNSRLITKPESDWLNTNNISNISGTTDESLNTETEPTNQATPIKEEPAKTEKVVHATTTIIKTIQPPIKAQVFKPDEAILARIKRSQQQAQSRRFSGTFNTKPQSPKPPQNTDDDNMPF